MKKVLLLLVLISAVSITSIMAQPPGGGMDPARMLEMMKERVKPQMMEKTKLTDAEADKVLEIQVEMQGKMRGMRDLSQEERKAKLKELNEERSKKLKAIPLTDEKVKAVQEFYEEQRKNRQQGGGGNN